jgi:hypothetical protein
VVEHGAPSTSRPSEQKSRSALARIPAVTWQRSKARNPPKCDVHRRDPQCPVHVATGRNAHIPVLQRRLDKRVKSTLAALRGRPYGRHKARESGPPLEASLRQLIKAGATPQSRSRTPPKQEGGFRAAHFASGNSVRCVISISDLDCSDARYLVQSRRQPPDRPRATDFDSERYNPLCWQVA